MKKKLSVLFIFILFAIPLPVAFLGALLSFALLIGSFMDDFVLVEFITALSGVIIGSTYFITYIYSWDKTIKESRITYKTFYPLIHCIIAFFKRII